MALSQSALSELLEAFRAGEGVDLVRESVRLVMQELIETEATERECVHVPLLEVERCTAGASRLFAPGQPHTLTELVADRLRRPTEVTHELTVEEGLVAPGMLAEELVAERGREDVAGVERLIERERQLVVHADVDDDARGP